MMKHKKAFTLIELLVVIAIIAVLMGILMPALNRVKKQAQTIACRSNIKSWGLCFKLYTDDHDGSFNPGWDVGETTLWMNALRDYYQDDDKMFRCPTAKIVSVGPGDFGTFKSWSREIQVPGGETRNYVGSYSINSWTNHMTQDRGARQEEWFWKTTHNLVGPASEIPVFADSTWHDAWPLETDAPLEMEDGFGSGDQGTTGEMNHFCIDRHNGKVNFAMMDWSVRGVGLRGLWTLKWHRTFNINGPYTALGGMRNEDWPAWLAKYSE